MRNLSPVFKSLFFLIVGGMIVLAVVALLTRSATPSAEEQIEQTVVAEVALRTTQTAAATPDIEGTVSARLESSPVPSADPNLIPVEQLESSGGLVSFIGGIVNAVFSLLRGLWDLFSFGGVGLQVCCCLLIPLGALAALARESR